MGNSRVICGDAHSEGTWSSITDGSVHVVVTSPP